MSDLDGRVLELAEIDMATTPELITAALSWAGQIRVEPNTWSSVCKQAVIDLLLRLQVREGNRLAAATSGT